MYDVAIIGAGVIGGMIARELSAYELNICLLEAENDVGRGSSSANSAVVHAGFDAKPGTLKARFNVEGSRIMKTVCEELGIKYKNIGSIVIGSGPDDLKTIKELYARGIENGVQGLYIADKDELHRLEPGLSDDFDCALVAPTGAIVCPYELTFAAVGNAMDNGAELLLNYRVSSIGYDGNAYTIRSTDGRETTAVCVVNCAGIHSDDVARMIGDDSFTITPRRGEYILLDKAEGNACSHTIFRTPTKMGKGILITPTVDDTLLLGPTSEDIEDKEDKSVTRHGLDRILSQVKPEMPRVNTGAVIRSFCGLRAVGSTGDFIINNPSGRFVNVAAIESPGLTSAPAIGRYVTEIIGQLLGELKPRDGYIRTRRSLHWFRDLTPAEKTELIAREPAYGRIICRCESVTEGEIIYAITAKPAARDLDGVKRRTRTQMGHCQGGFCSPFIARILTEGLNVPLDSITKRGGGSYILAGKTK